MTVPDDRPPSDPTPADPTSAEEGSITGMLGDIRAGNEGAQEALFRRVYDELRIIASSRIAGEGRVPAEGEATDLVHEAYARLSGLDFENRRHLFLTYARVMRNVLVDRARRNRSLKRGGDGKRVPLEVAQATAVSDSYRMDAIEGAELLKKLRTDAPGEADIFELRFFGGLSYRDIAAVLGVTEHRARTGWARSLDLIRTWTDDSRR